MTLVNRGQYIFNIIAGDCKDCVDASSLFSNLYKTNHPSVKVKDSIYLGNASSIDITKLMSNYQEGEVIILQTSTYEEARQLIYRISSAFNQTKFLFVSTLDNWGSLSANLIPNENYTEYWITPYLFDKKSKNYQTFLKYYSQKYSDRPRDAISYVTYSVIMSAVTALLNHSYDKKQDMRYNILKAYTAAIKQDPSWFKPKSDIVYKMDSDSIRAITTLPVINN
jgi:hypothetical protein